MNAHPAEITAETVLDRWRALAVIENNRMRAAMGLNPIIGAQTGPVLEMGPGKRATTRDAITAAIKKHGPWADTHLTAECDALRRENRDLQQKLAAANLCIGMRGSIGEDDE